MKWSLAHLFIISLCVSAQVCAFSWQDLWLTKDQQGQKLMEKGQYRNAKNVFKRNDWRAAAAYRSGDYEQATALYDKEKDEEALYNQGNALAHMGQYEKAIKAYDKALAINPYHDDARHNRKLLEKLLKQERKQQSQDKQGQDKQGQDKQGQDKQGQDKQGQDKQGQDKQGQDKQGQDKQGQDKQGQDKQGQDKQGQDKQGQDKQGQDKQGQDKQGQDKQGQDKQGQDKQGQDKQGQDKQGQDKQGQDKQGQDKKESQQSTNAGTQQSAITSEEKKRAKEQWLRLVPDDPGGLMREKFLRDHLKRQRGWYQ